MDEQRDVVVIGGGLAGLAAAATAARHGGRSVLVLDGHPGANRASTDEVGGYRFNRGAHALYRKGPGRAVLGRLGVTVAGGRAPATGSYGRRGDLVDVLPFGPVSSARSRLVSGGGKLRLVRFLAGMPRWRPERLAGLSAAAWFDEAGLDGDERGVVEMLSRVTTYVADLDEVSADLVALQLRSGLMGGVDYLHGGWATLLDGLARAGTAAGVERVPAAATAVVPDGGRVRVVVGGSGERTILAGAVVVAAGPPAACAALLPERPGAWASLGAPVRIACLDLGLPAPPVTKVLFGVDRPLYLSTHAPPADLAPPGAAVVHAMHYLPGSDDSAAAVLRAGLEEHCRLAGIDPDAADEVRYLHRMVACGAMPTPAGGGLAGRPGVTDSGDGDVFVAGDWLGGEGHLADAALVTGEQAGRLAATRADEGGRQAGRRTRLEAHG